MDASAYAWILIIIFVFIYTIVRFYKWKSAEFKLIRPVPIIALRYR